MSEKGARIRFAVTGGREYQNGEEVLHWLVRVVNRYGYDLELIHGNQRGLDKLAGDIAARLGFAVTPVPADWKRWGNAAGGERNGRMVRMKPEFVLAFSGHVGTANMIRQTREANIPVVGPHPYVDPADNRRVLGD